jgi:endonuclease/exonuclease/phosphatase family metal-dependent hydrolase
MKNYLNPAILTIILAFSTLVSSGQADQKKLSGKTFRIAFYNVENLFDTIDDPAADDADFLPGSRIAWTTERYDLKLSRLAEVIDALSDIQPLALMGLCEVENKMVLDDLVRSPQIIPYRYKVIHRESQDERGIDNAVLYDENQFLPLAVQCLKVDLSGLAEDLTRDILYVKGIDPKVKGDTLHVFVNHWPSRTEGKEISEPKRLKAAETLKVVTDSLFSLNPQALIIIMGDFNDEPSDKSITEGLRALPPAENLSGNGLYNLMDPLYHQGKGTLYYKDWDLFDQMILSGNFWNKEKGFVYAARQGNIFDPEWLMFTSAEGISRPNRTSAKEYYGGYSDHLPVYIDLIITK